MESPIAMYVPNFACPPTDPLEPELEPVPELDPEEPEVDP
jgi:hypothetical protein